MFSCQLPYMENSSRPFDLNNLLEINRLELALESAGIGTWELDRDANQMRWCHRGQNIFSSTTDNLIEYQDFLELIHPGDRLLFSTEMDNALDPKAPKRFSLEFRTRKNNLGGYQWLHCKGQSHTNTENGELRVLGTFSDITQEVESRRCLIEKQKRASGFEAVIDQAPLAIGLLTGPDFVIELGNDKLFEVWGKPSSIMGMRLADALPEIENQVFVDLLTEVYQTGIPYSGQGVLAHLRRFGVLEDVYFDFVYTPVRSDSGTVTGIMVMASEVTGYHNALHQLAHSEARFKALIEQAPFATSLLTGRDMTIELANSTIIDYWGKGESVIGKPLREALPELEGQGFLEILDQIYQTGVAYSSENASVNFEVGGKLNTYFFNFTYKPVLDNSGIMFGIVIMAIDVTAQALAQKALEESELKLKTVIESAPAAMGLMVGPDLRIEMTNQAFIHIVGKGQDIAGKPLAQVMPELESQPFLKILHNVYTTGVSYKTFGVQVDIVREGEMTSNFYDINYTPIYDSSGAIYAILNISTDVTERVSVEKQIRQSQMQLLGLFEQSPVGIAMIAKQDLTFTMANPFYGKLVGRDSDQIIGKPLMEVFPELAGQGFDKLLMDVFETGKPFLSREQAADIQYDGVLKTIYVNLAYQPQRDPDGQVTGILVVATELTDQVLSRKKIEEAQAFLQSAIELAQLGTYSIDLQTTSFNYSDRLKRWFGIQDQEEVTVENVYAAISQEDLPAVVSAFNEAITPGSGGQYDMEYTMDAEKTGSARVLHAQGKVFYDLGGVPVTMIGTVQDITTNREIKVALESQVQERTEQLASTNAALAATNLELLNSNNLLKQSNTNLQQFAYVASHDLQEPLRKIKSFANLLTERHGESLGDGGITYLNRMQSAAGRMSNLIDDLLTFSRVTSQKEHTGMVSLAKVISQVLDDVDLAVTESAAVISVGSMPEINGDEIQLHQLFQNLISNSLKFKRPDVPPAIQITSSIVSVEHLPKELVVTRTTGSFHKIIVADNGIGFDQKYADRIFQLFQRLHGRSEYAGTGIGLAICERVASNHGGGISVESRPGEGARFSVFFPV